MGNTTGTNGSIKWHYRDVASRNILWEVIEKKKEEEAITDWMVSKNTLPKFNLGIWSFLLRSFMRQVIWAMFENTKKVDTNVCI